MSSEDNEEELLPDKIDAYLSNLENIEELIGDKGVDSEGNTLFDVLHIDANGNTFDDVWANVKVAVGAPPAEDEAAAKIQAIIRGKQERALKRSARRLQRSSHLTRPCGAKRNGESQRIKQAGALR